MKLPGFRFCWSALAVAAWLGCSQRPAREHEATITWLIPVGPDRPLFERVIAGFEREQPDAHVEPVWVPVGQYQSKLKLLVAAGKPPDLICTADVWIGPVAPLLLDLDPLIARDRAELDLDDIPRPLLDACRWEGTTRCLPKSFHVSLLYFNRHLFDRAGEPYPRADWHLDDYRAAAARLTRRGSGKADSVWGSGITAGWWGEWLALVRAFGGDLFDPAISRCQLRSAAARDALAFYRGKIEPPAVAPPPGFAPDGDFSSGRLAMDFGGHTSLWPVYRRVPDLDWDVVPLPAGPSGSNGAELAVDTVAILERCAHRELAWELVKRLLSPEAVGEAAKHGSMPVRMSVARATVLAPGQTLPPRGAHFAYEALKTAKTAPRIAAFTELAIDVIQPEIDRILAGHESVESAAETAADDADALLRTLR
jgi:multiple sugar transport system substrate-binding protein